MSKLKQNFLISFELAFALYKMKTMLYRSYLINLEIFYRFGRIRPETHFYGPHLKAAWRCGGSWFRSVSRGQQRPADGRGGGRRLLGRTSRYQGNRDEC